MAADTPDYFIAVVPADSSLQVSLRLGRVR